MIWWDLAWLLISVCAATYRVATHGDFMTLLNGFNVGVWLFAVSAGIAKRLR